MNLLALNPKLSTATLERLLQRLYPLPRSISGAGLRESLGILQEYVPLELCEIPSGTPVLDWRVPPEWNVRDAFIKDSSGRRVVDWKASNLHLVAYSHAVNRAMSWRQLEPHLHTLPEHPDWIPYRTAYFRESPTWGFCLADRQREQLAAQGDEQQYEVVIDSCLEPGAMTLGELYLPGQRKEEVLIVAHTCHPSLANDNLAGIAVAVGWAAWLMEHPQPLSYRFLFAPATIGAISWLSEHRQSLDRVKYGLVLALLGDERPLTYKQTLSGDAAIDRAMAAVLETQTDHRIVPFEPFGYDERQFNSPAFRLPMGCLMRSLPGEYPQYHTSADDLELISVSAIQEAVRVCQQLSWTLAYQPRYLARDGRGEPQLGRRGLHRAHGVEPQALQRAVMWVLCLSDGGYDLPQIAARSGLPFAEISAAAQLLQQRGLLEPLHWQSPAQRPALGGLTKPLCEDPTYEDPSYEDPSYEDPPCEDKV